MEYYYRRDEQRGTLALTGEFTIYAVAEAKARLLAPLAECQDLEIDLAGVSDIDSAGLQLLILTQREARAAGQRLHLADPSPVVSELIALYGLGGWFGQAAAPAAAGEAA